MHAQQNVCVCFSEIAGGEKNRGRVEESTTESCCSGLLDMITAHAVHIHGIKHTTLLTGFRLSVI